jgi:hypothetical protein
MEWSLSKITEELEKNPPAPVGFSRLDIGKEFK